MKKLLNIEASKRITAHEALGHPLFSDLLEKDQELKTEMAYESKENFKL